MDDAFGQCQTPSKAERHAELLQALQEERTAEAADRPVHFSRRCDDTIHPIPPKDSDRAQEYATMFLDVCREANQPIQPTKVKVGARVFKFDGCWFDLNAFPDNIHGVHPGGIGIDHIRAKHITEKISAVIAGATRKLVESLLGLIEWVAIITPHIRSLVITLRRAMYTVTRDTDTVPTTNQELVADMQRMLTHFKQPRVVPFYHLHELTPPDKSTVESTCTQTPAATTRSAGGWKVSFGPSRSPRPRS